MPWTAMSAADLIRFLEKPVEEHCVVYLRRHLCDFCDLQEPVLRRVVERLGVRAHLADATDWTPQERERVEQACGGTRLTFPTTIAANPDPGCARWLLGFAPESVLVPFILDWSWGAARPGADARAGG